jgi:hypothetical protein
MSAILATQEAVIKRIAVQSQPMQIVCKTLSLKTQTKKKKRAGGVAQGVGSQFKPQYCKKKKKKKVIGFVCDLLTPSHILPTISGLLIIPKTV